MIDGLPQLAHDDGAHFSQDPHQGGNDLLSNLPFFFTNLTRSDIHNTTIVGGIAVLDGPHLARSSTYINATCSDNLPLKQRRMERGQSKIMTHTKEKAILIQDKSLPSALATQSITAVKFEKPRRASSPVHVAFFPQTSSKHNFNNFYHLSNMPNSVLRQS